MAGGSIRLHIESSKSGARSEAVFFWDDGEVSLGRDSEGNVTLEGHSVSRKHITLEPAPDGWVVTDHSSLGTGLNGVRLERKTPRLVTDGDTITIPGHTIAVEIEQAGGMGAQSDTQALKKLVHEVGLSDATGSIHVLIDGMSVATHEVGGEGAALIVGRGGEANIQLLDEYGLISTLHAKIERSWAGTFLYDLGSRNGTFVNGEKIDDCVPLEEGDRVTLAIGEERPGMAILVFSDSPASAHGESEPDMGNSDEGGADEENLLSEELKAEQLEKLIPDRMDPEPKPPEVPMDSQSAPTPSKAPTKPEEPQPPAPKQGMTPDERTPAESAPEKNTNKEPKKRKRPAPVSNGGGSFMWIVLGVATAAVAVIAWIVVALMKG